ncbi:SGNH/GDSL hydrolase family protein [Arthrobacter sp. StoSoilB13]|uniref:SGNH/GDSL hydrolase family protein n=1 Tax=Arthrobacter sp. StoSoilB13 TaxID=2830993 RepID=UPI001CC7E793|nr:SGNH/GDSL hydrolase family protein [Arthrobacter sp. StoSoilB13]BCW47889.1 hypothetical protein StoSoilB13_02310 [Arthrobacter sp. StoSoilB13]
MTQRLVSVGDDFTLPAAVKAADINLPVRLQGAALNASYAQARRAVYGPRWVFDGDSITINGFSTVLGNQDRSRSWTSEMARQSMGRIRFVFNAAVAGYRSDQVLARFDTYVAPQNPDVVLLTIGTNDIGQGYTMASWLANVQGLLRQVQSHQRRPCDWRDMAH